jgi:hypothetical protein
MSGPCHSPCDVHGLAGARRARTSFWAPPTSASSVAYRVEWRMLAGVPSERSLRRFPASRARMRKRGLAAHALRRCVVISAMHRSGATDM